MLTNTFRMLAAVLSMATFALATPSFAGDSKLVTQSAAKPASSHYVGVIGFISRPGVYEVPAASCELAQLIAGAGGLTEEASGQVRIVRQGRVCQVVSLTTPQAVRLAVNDLVIVDRRSYKTAESSKPGAKPTGPEMVQIGIVQLLSRPIVIEAPADSANLKHLLIALRQRLPHSRELMVIHSGSGQKMVPLAQAEQHLLPNCSVVVFEPKQADLSALPILPATLALDPAALAATHVPAGRLSSKAGETPRVQTTSVAGSGKSGPALVRMAPHAADSARPGLLASPSDSLTAAPSPADRLASNPEPLASQAHDELLENLGPGVVTAAVTSPLHGTADVDTAGHSTATENLAEERGTISHNGKRHDASDRSAAMSPVGLGESTPSTASTASSPSTSRSLFARLSELLIPAVVFVCWLAVTLKWRLLRSHVVPSPSNPRLLRRRRMSRQLDGQLRSLRMEGLEAIPRPHFTRAPARSAPADEQPLTEVAVTSSVQESRRTVVQNVAAEQIAAGSGQSPSAPAEASATRIYRVDTEREVIPGRLLDRVLTQVRQNRK